MGEDSDGTSSSLRMESDQVLVLQERARETQAKEKAQEESLEEQEASARTCREETRPSQEQANRPIRAALKTHALRLIAAGLFVVAMALAGAYLVRTYVVWWVGSGRAAILDLATAPLNPN